MASAYKIAEGFVLEYLQRDIEFIDVAEYAEEYSVNDQDELAEVFNHVVGLLNDEAQRFADRNN